MPNAPQRPRACSARSVLDEGALHRAIGGSKVMRSQLFRLAETAEHPQTTIQVIRFAGAHAGLLGGFIIADVRIRLGPDGRWYPFTCAQDRCWAAPGPADSPGAAWQAALRARSLRRAGG